MKKVLVGMSGGVDSSVTALILKQLGYDVAGVTFKLYSSVDVESGCCSVDDVNDAKFVCDTLGIPHYVVNYKELFQNEVIEYFVREYMQGRTPNPCIACNKKIKFSAFLDKADMLSFDYIATGHYSKIEYFNDRYHLIKSNNKDQSYVLYGFTQKQLSKTLMPLGDIEKTKVRQIAQENGLIVHKKPDSQDVCFIPNGKYGDFLEKYLGTTCPQGRFVDMNGHQIGIHKGIWHYTIGQRKGLGSFGKPMFVKEIDVESGNIVLSDEKYIFSKELECTDVNLIEFDFLKDEMEVTAKIRYAHTPSPARIIPLQNGNLKVVFKDYQRAITKGQSVVFYDGNTVIGGGTII